ncbi:hypothetical protein [Phytohabitans houttuyneae]|uniref:hypothetical protein n=1 Tax=Phytohabitans houttuyneae TaxID=1076126 RepID=UPI0015643810|nr:hypothetical protein [Phytohabitans houttuyneae]
MIAPNVIFVGAVFESTESMGLRIGSRPKNHVVGQQSIVIGVVVDAGISARIIPVVALLYDLRPRYQVAHSIFH